MNKKKCSKCGIVKLESSDYFYYRKDRKKYKNECIECHKKRQNAKVNNFIGPQYDVKKTKLCRSCQKEYPSTAQNFHAQPLNKDGIKNVCKKCCATEYQEYWQENSSELYSRYRVRMLEKQKEYRKSEKGKTASKLKSNRRRSRVLNSPFNDFSNSDWHKCLKYFNNQCSYCGMSSGELEQEHIVPLSKNGSNTATNVIPACRSCNASKSDKTLEMWYSKQFFYDREREEMIYKWMNCEINDNKIQMQLF